MIEPDTRPGRLQVTRFALWPQQTFVDVVGLVATDTGKRRLPFGGRLEMAAGTGGRLVGAGQGEPGLRMVKRHRLPALGRVTVRTGCAILALVHIVNPVTGNAILRGRIWLAHTVACRTFGTCMFADEPEPGPVVIEPGLGPAGRIVARGAVWTERAFVDIIRLVAIDAFRLQPCPNLILVAGSAGRALVLAE